VNQPHQLAAVILAAGESSRMGRSKPLLRFEGQTFLDRAISCFDGLTSPIVVVVGYGAAEIRAGIETADGVEFVNNPDPSRGMLSSLQCGLATLPRHLDAVLFMPADLPRLRRSTVEILASTSGQLVIPRFNERNGHPVRVSTDIARELLALPVAAKASDVIHRHRATFVDVDDPGVLHDIDTPADYEALVGASAQP
jgi:molybdenum cofactor cytidylyltransferase